MSSKRLPFGSAFSIICGTGLGSFSFTGCMALSIFSLRGVSLGCSGLGSSDFPHQPIVIEIAQTCGIRRRKEKGEGKNKKGWKEADRRMKFEEQRISSKPDHMTATTFLLCGPPLMTACCKCRAGDVAVNRSDRFRQRDLPENNRRVRPHSSLFSGLQFQA